MLCLNKRAFTLVEAILGIVIVGILASIILPRFIKEGFISNLTLRTATSQIASDIRYTRSLAVTHSLNHIIDFNFKTKEYRIYRDRVSSNNQIGETKKIPEDISCSGTDQFVFYPLGNCSYKGQGISLSLSSGQYTIKVEPPSGVVVIDKEA